MYLAALFCFAALLRFVAKSPWHVQFIISVAFQSLLQRHEYQKSGKACGISKNLIKILIWFSPCIMYLAALFSFAAPLRFVAKSPWHVQFIISVAFQSLLQRHEYQKSGKACGVSQNLIKILIWFSPCIMYLAALFCFAASFILWQNLPGKSSLSYLMPFRVFFRGMNIKNWKSFRSFPKSSQGDEECLTYKLK